MPIGEPWPLPTYVTAQVFPHIPNHGPQLDRIERKLDRLIQEDHTMALDLSNLTAAVNNEQTVDQSVLALINQIVAELQNTNGDQAAVDALTASLQTEASSLSAAVSANTPAAPAPAPSDPTLDPNGPPTE